MKCCFCALVVATTRTGSANSSCGLVADIFSPCPQGEQCCNETSRSISGVCAKLGPCQNIISPTPCGYVFGPDDSFLPCEGGLPCCSDMTGAKVGACSEIPCGSTSAIPYLVEEKSWSVHPREPSQSPLLRTTGVMQLRALTHDFEDIDTSVLPVIAVLDEFIEDLLQVQRKAYTNCIIEHVRSFPYETSKFPNPLVITGHGNEVIDIIVSMLPTARIQPIMYHQFALGDVFQWLLEQKDILIINLSRGWPLLTEDTFCTDLNFSRFPAQSSNDKQRRLCQQLATRARDFLYGPVLTSLVRSKLLVKAAGNAGVDLTSGQQRTSAEVHQCMDLSEDVRLIPATMVRLPRNADFLLALNVESNLQHMDWCSNIPGQNSALQQSSLAAPASSVYLASKGSVQGGTSYAAPQLSAIAAILLALAKSPKAQFSSCLQDSTVTPSLALRAMLLTGTYPMNLPRNDLGKGLVNASAAWLVMADECQRDHDQLDRQLWWRSMTGVAVIIALISILSICISFFQPRSARRAMLHGDNGAGNKTEQIELNEI